MIKEVERVATVGDTIKTTSKLHVTTSSAGIKENETMKILQVWGADPVVKANTSSGFIRLYEYEYVVLEECEPTLSEATESELEAELKKRREPKYFTGDVVCTRSIGCFTTGKIYHIENGVLNSENTASTYTGIVSIDSLNARLISKFLEIVK